MKQWRTVMHRGQVITPSKVVCIGRNYAEHIHELGNETSTEPVVFIKPNSAINQTDNIRLTRGLHYETELCFLIEQQQLVAVAVGLDLTDRAKQQALKNKGLPWERAKAFDDSACFSEFVPLPTSLERLSLRLLVNGELRQQGGVALMLQPPLALLVSVLADFTCDDGDILMTGTPKGVGALQVGDCLVAQLYHQQQLLVQQQWRVVAP